MELADFIDHLLSAKATLGGSTRVNIETVRKEDVIKYFRNDYFDTVKEISDPYFMGVRKDGSLLIIKVVGN